MFCCCRSEGKGDWDREKGRKRGFLPTSALSLHKPVIGVGSWRSSLEEKNEVITQLVGFRAKKKTAT